MKKITLINFFKKKRLSEIINLSQKPKLKQKMILNTPYPPDLNDLYRLYKFIIDNNRTTILEFGSGWSSIIFLIALSELKKKIKND